MSNTVCPQCGGTGLADAVLTPADLARSIVHKTVKCSSCGGEGVIGGEDLLLQERQITSAAAAADGGWEVTYSCGHQAIWMIEPQVKTLVCAQCVNEFVDRHRAKAEAK